MPGQWINRPFSFHLLLRYRENYYRFWCHFFLFLFFATFNFLLCCPLNKFDSNLKFEYLLLSETYSLFETCETAITIKHGLKIIIYVLLLFLRNFNFHNR